MPARSNTHAVPLYSRITHADACRHPTHSTGSKGGLVIMAQPRRFQLSCNLQAWRAGIAQPTTDAQVSLSDAGIGTGTAAEAVS
jgi:hypothetical protein